MALVIRLRQQGKTNRRSFRLVVTDVKAPRDGKYLEKLGSYDPHFESQPDINGERIKYWLGQGALISEKAKSLVARLAPEIIKELNDKKIDKKLKAKKKKAEAASK